MTTHQKTTCAYRDYSISQTDTSLTSVISEVLQLDQLSRRKGEEPNIKGNLRDKGYKLEEVPFETLKGLTFTRIIIRHKSTNVIPALLFITAQGDEYIQYHQQRCCEVVEMESTSGNIHGILHSEIVTAEEMLTHTDVTSNCPIRTYGFYTLKSNGDIVNVTWRGTWDCAYLEDQDLQNGQCSLYKLVPLEKFT